jgi:hypothetical protein
MLNLTVESSNSSMGIVQLEYGDSAHDMASMVLDPYIQATIYIDTKEIMVMDLFLTLKIFTILLSLFSYIYDLGI